MPAKRAEIVLPEITRSDALPASEMRNELKAMPMSALVTVLFVTFAYMLFPRRMPVLVMSWTRLSSSTMFVERTTPAEPEAK